VALFAWGNAASGPAPVASIEGTVFIPKSFRVTKPFTGYSRKKSSKPEKSSKPAPVAGKAWALPASGWFVPERLRDPDRKFGPGAGRQFPRSETLRSVQQAGHPGLGVVALGDDRGDAPANACQWTPYALRDVVVHRSSSVSGYVIAGHYRVSL